MPLTKHLLLNLKADTEKGKNHKMDQKIQKYGKGCADVHYINPQMKII